MEDVVGTDVLCNVPVGILVSESKQKQEHKRESKISFRLVWC